MWGVVTGCSRDAVVTLCGVLRLVAVEVLEATLCGVLRLVAVEVCLGIAAHCWGGNCSCAVCGVLQLAAGKVQVALTTHCRALAASGCGQLCSTHACFF